MIENSLPDKALPLLVIALASALYFYLAYRDSRDRSYRDYLDRLADGQDEILEGTSTGDRRKKARKADKGTHTI